MRVLLTMTPPVPSGGGQHRCAPDVPDRSRGADRGVRARFRRRSVRRELRLDFLVRLRGERRFETAEALIEQMHSDVRRTREIAQAVDKAIAPAGVCYRARTWPR